MTVIYQYNSATNLYVCGIAHEAGIRGEEALEILIQWWLRLCTPYCIVVTRCKHHVYTTGYAPKTARCRLILLLYICNCQIILLSRVYTYPVHDITCNNQITDVYTSAPGFFSQPVHKAIPCIFPESMATYMHIGYKQRILRFFIFA